MEDYGFDIQTVKISGEGYLLNGSMHVPAADGNSHYEAIKKWLAAGNVPTPEFTAEEIQANEDRQAVAEAKQLLNDTDWIVVKINEASVQGEDVSALLTQYADQLTARAEARTTINTLEV